MADNPGMPYSNETPLPVVIPFAPNDATVTVQYLSGLTNEFGGTPEVDAVGYSTLSYGSGIGRTGVGNASFFPSYYIDPLNFGPPIYLGALIGAFIDNLGGVVGFPFAPGNGVYTALIPVDAVGLALGLNDDIFSDNIGALSVSVTTSAVPEPSAWAMMLIGLAGLGFVSYRRAQAAA